MRIIAGEHRGRKLLPPAGQVTRPITDRVKESLFNILTPWIPQANVADLFSGTGSMGLEALSRGAQHCWFADRDRGAIDRLKKNIATLSADDRSTLWQGDIVARLADWLAALPVKLDVIFVDPPYPLARQWREDPAAGAKAAESVFNPLADALADDGVVVLRTPREMPQPDFTGKLTCHRRREYGSMALDFLAVDDAEPIASEPTR